MRFSSAAAISILASVAAAIPLEVYSNDLTLTNSDVDWTIPLLSDDAIVNAALDTFSKMQNSTNVDQCTKCQSRLVYGKSLAMTRPDLIPTIFELWCNIKGDYSATTCNNKFHRTTVSNSSTGSNFADLLTLIDPLSIDGEYWCHYQAKSECPLPETPENLSISYLWNNTRPEKADTVPIPGNDTFKVLHISDFHLELDYTVGAEANCTTSMCCTPHSLTPKNAINSNQSSIHDLYTALFEGSYYDAEGNYHIGEQITALDNISVPSTTFGNYECDAPEVLINSSLHSIADFQAKNNISFEFAIFTGDLVDHDETKYTSYEKSVEEETMIFRDIKTSFKNLPLYPVLGNHDTFPYAQLAPEKSGFQNKFNWNVELLSEMWMDYGWIDWDQAQFAKTHYGAYSVNLKSGLKIISFNSNAWYLSNEYAYSNNVDDPDYFGIFEFIVNELLESEAADQKVWLNFHIPLSNTVLPTAAKLFSEMVARFSPYTITGILTGHTHRDEFNLLYKNNNGTVESKQIEDVINFTWITQAVTPWVENNPAWRYYEVDSDTFQIMDSLNYYTHLNETFASSDEPVWEFEYSARDVYDIDWPASAPLNATYWHLVYDKMRTNATTLQTYENLSKRFSPYVKDCSDGNVCSWDICYVSSYTTEEYTACMNAYPDYVKGTS